MACSKLLVEMKLAGEAAYGFLPHLAMPAEMLTRFCSAIPTSTNCSGKADANGARDADPLESLHNTTTSLSSFACSISTSQMT